MGLPIDSASLRRTIFLRSICTTRSQHAFAYWNSQSAPLEMGVIVRIYLKKAIQPVAF